MSKQHEKEYRYYIAVDLNRFNDGNNCYWSEGVWVLDRHEATLYNSLIKAEMKAKKFAIQPAVEIVSIKKLNVIAKRMLHK